MRLFFCLILAAGPAYSWEFEASPLCRIWQAQDSQMWEVVHDPTDPLPYRISITRAEGWVDGTVFSIDFLGGADLTISTSRQMIDGATLSVSDVGFGNVLDGLALNALARAQLGTAVSEMPLDGAADAVERFRACAAGGLV